MAWPDKTNRHIEGINMEKKFLLNDQEMKKFIVDGYHVVKTSLPLSFHQKVHRQTLDLIQNEGLSLIHI